MAVLTATGRDIKDQEETLEFDDCRWNRTTDPEQLQFGLLVMLLQKLLRQGAFQGTATELADWLGYVHGQDSVEIVWKFKDIFEDMEGKK